MYNPPPPAPVSNGHKTTASRFAWLPVAVGAGGVALAVATGGLLGYLLAPAALAASGSGGWWLWRKHNAQLEAQDAQRFEQLALTAFRRHSGPTMTKEQLVRDHGLHPDEAEAVLNWLVTHELLTANWENYEGPLVYERSDAAAGLPVPKAMPAPAEPKTRRKRGTRQVVVHHHHAPPPAGYLGEYKNPSLAMALSFFWPGVGQMYAGNVGRGLAWMFGTWLGYCMLVIPGLIAHIMNVVNARETAEETNQYLRQYGAMPGQGPPPSLPGSHGYGQPPPPNYLDE